MNCIFCLNPLPKIEMYSVDCKKCNICYGLKVSLKDINYIHFKDSSYGIFISMEKNITYIYFKGREMCVYPGLMWIFPDNMISVAKRLIDVKIFQ